MGHKWTRLQRNTTCDCALSSPRHCKGAAAAFPTYSEVTHESQPYSLVHECLGTGGLLQAAVDFAGPGRFVHDSPSRAGRFDYDDATC